MMKKYFLTAVFAMLASVYVMAASGLTLKDGNKSFLKVAEGKAVLEFVWKGAQYDNKQPLTEKFKNLEELKPIAWNGFTEEFNKHSKNLQVVKDAKDAAFKFTMQVTNMDQYFKVLGFIPSNATKVWGTMTVTNLKTGKVMLVLDVAAVDGGANPSPDGTFSDCFEKLGKSMAKFK